MIKKDSKKNYGFSLIELIVVLAIMAVLVAVLSPSILGYIEKAKEKKDAAALGEFFNELYISASNLENWNGITGDMEFDYDPSTKSIPILTSTNSNTFATEVAQVVGDEIEFQSNLWQSADLKIKVSPVWDTIHVTVSGEFPEGYDFNNVTVTATP